MIWNVLTCVALLWCALLTAWRFVDGLKDFRALLAAVQRLKPHKRQKNSTPTQPIVPLSSVRSGSSFSDVELALVGMGYNKTTANAAINRALGDGTGNMSREELLKAALKVVNQ